MTGMSALLPQQYQSRKMSQRRKPPGRRLILGEVRIRPASGARRIRESGTAEYLHASELLIIQTVLIALSSVILHRMGITVLSSPAPKQLQSDQLIRAKVDKEEYDANR